MSNATAERLLAGAERDGTAQVSYSAWEPDPDAPPAYRKHVRSPREAVDWLLFGGIAEMHPSIGGWRRKRFVVARDESGQTVGRWTWEYKSA